VSAASPATRPPWRRIHDSVRRAVLAWTLVLILLMILIVIGFTTK
jgi:hypothetical protein